MANEKFLAEYQNFLGLSKILRDENLDVEEKMDNLHQLLQSFLKLEKIGENDRTLPIITKIYFAGEELHAHFENQKKILKEYFDEIKLKKNYRSQQAQLRAKGKIERKKRTHQLILIGAAWENFCKKYNLPEKNNVNDFDGLLKKISGVAHRRLPVLKNVFAKIFYDGNNKTIIHKFCCIGGAWEAFFRKNFCSKKICAQCPKKISCKKLDEKYFASFLSFHRQKILTLLSK